MFMIEVLEKGVSFLQALASTVFRPSFSADYPCSVLANLLHLFFARNHTKSSSKRIPDQLACFLLFFH